MDDDHQVAISLSEFHGKLDLLGTKMDSKIDLILEKIDSGDRESRQIAKLLEAELTHLKTGQEELSKRITNVAVEGQDSITKVRTKLEQLESFRSSIKGTIALLMVLMPILTALVVRAITNLPKP